MQKRTGKPVRFVIVKKVFLLKKNVDIIAGMCYNTMNQNGYIMQTRHFLIKLFPGGVIYGKKTAAEEASFRLELGR